MYVGYVCVCVYVVVKGGNKKTCTALTDRQTRQTYMPTQPIDRHLAAKLRQAAIRQELCVSSLGTWEQKREGGRER